MESNSNIDFENDNKDEIKQKSLNIEFQVDHEPKPDETKINRYLIHKPLQYGKKLYIGEFLAERFIQFVALISICAIIAIFYYVFQEATYAFKSPVKSAKSKIESNSTYSQQQQNQNVDNNDLKPESYNSTDNASDNNLKPDQYKPDKYVPDNVSNNNKESIINISNDSTIFKSNQYSEIYNSEKPITLKEILTPNDYIDNKPEYIWQPISTVPKYSFIPLFFGALKVTIIGLFIAAPLAIFAAIFTVAFAPKWIKEIIKPAIEVLAGFPSVVIGFFCLMTLASVIQDVFHTTFRLNAFVGGIGMALAVIPIIYTITEDALSAVPKFMKEASFALGGSRWQTAWRVLLPAATPGVFAALILGFGRAFGETMIALMATGNAALVSTNIFESVRTMSATIGAEMAEVEFRGIHYGVLFLIGAILFIVTFSLNALAEFYIRKKLMKKFQGL